eukprot:15449068-Alexandrium_andersonii.AAC.1
MAAPNQKLEKQATSCQIGNRTARCAGKQLACSSDPCKDEQGEAKRHASSERGAPGQSSKTGLE